MVFLLLRNSDSQPRPISQLTSIATRSLRPNQEGDAGVRVGKIKVENKGSRACPQREPMGRIRAPRAREQLSIGHWNNRQFEDYGLSVRSTDPLLHFPMLQGAKRLPGPLRPKVSNELMSAE